LSKVSTGILSLQYSVDGHPPGSSFVHTHLPLGNPHSSPEPQVNGWTHSPINSLP
jgi:hypothetical protein